MRRGLLEQGPHRVRDDGEKNLELAIGRDVRTFHLQPGMTVADLAVRTGLSMGMLSETENGNTLAALRTLQILADGISVSLTWFVRRYEERREAVYVKSGEAVVIERAATRSGHQCNLLGYLGANTTGVVMEPYYISLTAQSDVFPTFQHDGVELPYMLAGEIVYRHG